MLQWTKCPSEAPSLLSHRLSISRVQGPSNVIVFILAIVETIFAIILLGISGYLNPFACGTGILCSATALGIVAGVFGMLIGILAILRLIISEVADMGFLKFVVIGGMFGVALFAVISAILYAVRFLCCEVAAGAVFGFFLTIVAVLLAIFSFMADE